MAGSEVLHYDYWLTLQIVSLRLFLAGLLQLVSTKMDEELMSSESEPSSKVVGLKNYK